MQQRTINPLVTLRMHIQGEFGCFAAASNLFIVHPIHTAIRQTNGLASDHVAVLSGSRPSSSKAASRACRCSAIIATDLLAPKI